MLVALSVLLQADQVKVEALACPTIEKLKAAPAKEEADTYYMKLNSYVVANDCRIFSVMIAPLLTSGMQDQSG